MTTRDIWNSLEKSGFKISLLLFLLTISSLGLWFLELCSHQGISRQMHQCFCQEFASVLTHDPFVFCAYRLCIAAKRVGRYRRWIRDIQYSGSSHHIPQAVLFYLVQNPCFELVFLMGNMDSHLLCDGEEFPTDHLYLSTPDYFSFTATFELGIIGPIPSISSLASQQNAHCTSSCRCNSVRNIICVSAYCCSLQAIVFLRTYFRLYTMLVTPFQQ